MITNFILVGLGAIFGAIFRYALTLLIKNLNFPFSMLIINALGSFIIGLVSILFKENVYIYSFLAVGILGGFTSFSTFSLDTILMFENGKILFGFLNIFTSIFTCLILCFIGRKLGTIILKV